MARCHGRNALHVRRSDSSRGADAAGSSRLNRYKSASQSAMLPHDRRNDGSIGMAATRSAAGRDGGHDRRRSLRAASPDVGRHRLEAPGNRPRRRSCPRPRRCSRRCRSRNRIGGKDRARGQIRAGRSPSARCLHARDGGIGPAGADLHPWRRLRRRQQADNSDQPVLRQCHAVGRPQRLCRRQRHLSARAAIDLPGGRRGPCRRRGLGRRQDRRARRRPRAHLS